MIGGRRIAGFGQSEKAEDPPQLRGLQAPGAISRNMASRNRPHNSKKKGAAGAFAVVCAAFIRSLTSLI